MLNISKNTIRDKINVQELKAAEHIKLPKANRMMAWWLSVLLVITIITFFLPWTQNIQMKGKVTTLSPEQRPQDINTMIDGRIDQWFIREGQLVQKGDTIVRLSEIKVEYLDPNLLDRTAAQITAKEGSIDSYTAKSNALSNQISALESDLVLKREQLKNKIVQTQLKAESNEAMVQRAKIDAEIADFQMRRTDTLFQKGIKSLNDLESKQLKVQESKAKFISIQNKLLQSQNEVTITQLQLQNIENEYQNKIAKAKSERYTTLSAVFDSKGNLNKLQNQYENYNTRNNLYHIVAPQTGYITKTIKSGIGEIIKVGETLVTIVPYERELAVQMYVKPMDLPLMQTGQEVRMIFDGWQAFVISGWSNVSFGTYSGEVIAIDNIPNEKSQYRILVKSNDPEKPFPDLLRVGAGAQGIALLKNVPVWYEVWRQLNGFPADFYEENMENQESKFKPPVKSVAK